MANVVSELWSSPCHQTIVWDYQTISLRRSFNIIFIALVFCPLLSLLFQMIERLLDPIRWRLSFQSRVGMYLSTWQIAVIFGFHFYALCLGMLCSFQEEDFQPLHPLFEL